MACIKFLGKCACPLCLVKKDDFWKMGTKTDMKNRLTKLRVDTPENRNWLTRIRDWIFSGRGPESAAVQWTPINDQSMRPIQVRRSLS